MKDKIKKSWYDPEMDILYIQVKEGILADSREISDDFRFDLDQQGDILGIEVHQARTKVLEPIWSEIVNLLSESLQSSTESS